MRGNHSNSKLVFAYQDLESRAAAHNPALDPNAVDSTIIRIVEPLEAGTKISTHHNYDPDGTELQQMGVDHLVSASVSAIIATTVTGATSNQNVSNPVKSISVVQPAAGAKVIDIVLTSGLMDSINTQSKLYKAVIELMFSSGDVEDLVLNLKTADGCKLIIDPLDIQGSESFSVSVAEVATTLPPNIIAQRTAYSISKGYRRLNERLNASNGTGTSRNLYGIGFTGYTPFSAPFGIVHDNIVEVANTDNFPALISKAGNLSWVGPNGYATTKPTNLTWFTGNQDMTGLRITTTDPQLADDGVQDINIPSNFLQNLGVNISPFFKKSVSIDRATSLTQSLGSLVFPEGRGHGEGLTQNLNWGQNFGWFSSLVSGNIVGPGGNVVLTEGDMNFGVPPIWRESYLAPNSNPGSIDRPTAFWGTFSDELGPNDGSFLQSYDSSNNPSTASANQDAPEEVRYSKLFWGAQDYLPGTEVSNYLVVAAQAGSEYQSSFLAQYDYNQIKTYFQFIPDLDHQPYNGWTESSFRRGSVYSVTTNPGANFFYGGCAGTQSDAYMPVFKGIARTGTIIRYTSTSETSLAAQILRNRIESNLIFGHLDEVGMYLGAIGVGDGPDGTIKTQRMGETEILWNLIFHSHNYPRHLIGDITDTQSAHIVPGSQAGFYAFYNVGFRLLVDPEANVGIDSVDMHVQDIVFLNSGYVPDKHNGISSNQLELDQSDSKARAVIRNHPLSGCSFSKGITTVTPSYTHFKNTDFAGTVKPFAVTSRPYHADMGESSLEPIPPYPYAPTFLKTEFTKSAFMNFAGADEGADGYFYPQISSNGETFLSDSADQTGIVLPTSVQQGSIYTGTNQCLLIYGSIVTVKGANGTELTQAIGQGTISIEYKLFFVNQCSGQFTTAAGSKVTTGTTVADRVTEVLQIFPHIEYRPLAMLDVTDGSPLAYTNIIEDENDVDDIYIEENQGNYSLTIVITADASDIIEVAGSDVEAPYADIWPDTVYPTDPSTDNTVLGDFSTRYISANGETEFNRHKASYITIASASDWATFTNDATTIQSTSADSTRFAYHTPFIVYGNNPDIPDIETNIPGCTNPDAINYNADATLDDGSCTDCDTFLLNNFGWDIINNGINNGQTGMRIGVYSSASDAADGSDGSYLCGLAGGNTPLTNYLDIPGTNSAAVYNSTGAKYGGAVVANNDFIDNTAVVRISIKGVNQGAGTFTNVLNWMASLGEDETAWNLKIRAMGDQFDSLNYESSYSASNVLPFIVNAQQPAYSSDATGGTIQNPTWDNIVIPTNPQLWARSGRAYMLQLTLDPKNLPSGCTALDNGYNVVLGVFWISFCSCASVSNDYWELAMSGPNGGLFSYPWNVALNQPFPIVSYEGNNSCPDAVSGPQLLGDNAYPNSICFLPDDQTGNCEQYWLYCIADYATVCSNDPDNVTDTGTTTYFNYESGYITTAIEGVYNPPSNSYVFDPDIQYTITVTGPNGYFEVQTQNSANSDLGYFVNTFIDVVQPGVYTVTFEFLAPYVEYFSDEIPCQFIETVTIQSPLEAGCGDIVSGCTDPQADNFDENATVDDGSCETTDPCEDSLLNPNFTTTVSTTNSDSNCITDTIIIEGVEFESTVPVPINNGAMTVQVTYSPPTSGLNINQFAVLLIHTSSSNPNIQNIIDSVDAMFGSTPSNTIDGVTIDGVGYWSPLTNVGTVSQVYNIQFTGLAPGNYYVIVAANPSSTSLVNCSGSSFADIQAYFTIGNVGMNDPESGCPEPCLGPNCEDYVLGCTDPDDDNYNPEATYDDGSCETIPTHCEQNPNDEDCDPCLGETGTAAPRYAIGNVDEPPCIDPFTDSDGFCTDPNACNYNPDAPLDSSNNSLCDYCSCVGADDPDCFEDTDCDPDTDPNCGGPEPECPDPSNPDCNPTVYDPCPTGDCEPPGDPCLILGNCPDDGDVEDPPEDPFVDIVNPVEVTCQVDVEGQNGPLNFNDVQLQAFQCMSQEGQKMMFRMKQGAYYDDTDILKLSLISYLFAGGLNNSQISCLFNCNYDSADKARAFSCATQWADGGGKFFNSTDTYNKGDIVLYYYKEGNQVTRNYYIATREITPLAVHPRFPGSGWDRCQDVKLRTADRNGIATGEEEYLQVFWEYLTRFCTQCEVVSVGTGAEDVNNVDPKVLKNYIDPKTRNNNPTGSGIIGEDGEEIIF